MENEVEDFHFVALLKFAVLALCYTIATVAKILQSQPTVWEIGDLQTGSLPQISRAYFIVWSIYVGSTILLYL